MQYRPLMDRYRSLSRVPPAHRLHRNMAICRYFCFVMLAAVDAGDTFPTFSYVLLITLHLSFCRGNIDTLGERLHPPLQVYRRKLLATAYTDKRSVATMAPAGTWTAALWSSRERKMVGGVGHAPVLRRNRGEAKRRPGPRRTSAQQERNRAATLGGGADSPPPVEGGLRGAVSPQQGQCYDAVYRQR